MTEGLMGNRFYVLADGECCLYKQSQEESAGLSFAGRTIQKWEIFGESDVFYNAKRVWSCKCTRHGVVRMMPIQALCQNLLSLVVFLAGVVHHQERFQIDNYATRYY